MNPLTVDFSLSWNLIPCLSMWAGPLASWSSSFQTDADNWSWGNVTQSCSKCINCIAWGGLDSFPCPSFLSAKALCVLGALLGFSRVRQLTNTARSSGHLLHIPGRCVINPKGFDTLPLCPIFSALAWSFYLIQPPRSIKIFTVAHAQTWQAHGEILKRCWFN